MDSLLLKLDADGVPVPASIADLGTLDYILARTVLGDGFVSTIFLVVRPLVGPAYQFETMTFGIPGREYEGERYRTKAEALAGHAAHVAMARDALAAALPQAQL